MIEMKESLLFGARIGVEKCRGNTVEMRKSQFLRGEESMWEPRLPPKSGECRFES